jgi:hypothetical protein
MTKQQPTAKDSIEQVVLELQHLHFRLGNIIQVEKYCTPKHTLAQVYIAQAEISHALAQILTVTTTRPGC